MKAIDKERAITTRKQESPCALAWRVVSILVRDLELDYRTRNIPEAAVVKAGIERGRGDTRAIIDELVTVGVLYRPGKGQIARVER